MLYQDFKHVTVIQDRQAYIVEDPDYRPLTTELRQLVIDLVDHSSFICWPLKPTPEERTESREVSAICKDLKEKIIAAVGKPGYITIPISTDFAVLIRLKMNDEGDDTDYYRRYPDQVKLIMEPLKFINLVSYPVKEGCEL